MLPFCSYTTRVRGSAAGGNCGEISHDPLMAVADLPWPDGLEHVGKGSPPHCGHIRRPLLGQLVGGVRSGDLRRRISQMAQFVSRFLSARRYPTLTLTKKRITVVPSPAGRGGKWFCVPGACLISCGHVARRSGLTRFSVLRDGFSRDLLRQALCDGRWF